MTGAFKDHLTDLSFGADEAQRAKNDRSCDDGFKSEKKMKHTLVGSKVDTGKWRGVPGAASCWVVRM